MQPQLIAAIGLLVLDLVEAQRRANRRNLPEGTEIREAQVRRIIDELEDSTGRIESRMSDGPDSRTDDDATPDADDRAAVGGEAGGPVSTLADGRTVGPTGPDGEPAEGRPNDDDDDGRSGADGDGTGGGESGEADNRVQAGSAGDGPVDPARAGDPTGVAP